MRPLTMTFDVEEHRPQPDSPYRLGQVIDAFCTFMAERSGQASVYVVGTFAQDHPEAVRQLADAGHEIGLHSWTHEPVFRVPKERFAREVTRGRQLLQELSGQPVAGFRAPYLSLTPQAPWAPDVLGEAGFHYSSSVYPGRAPLYGWPGAPTGPFRWSSGLVELPCPLAGIGPAKLPFLGSVYLRALPPMLLRGLARRWPEAKGPLWTYSHPYEFDATEPFWRMEPSWVQSKLLWLNRKNAWSKMARLVGPTVGPPLGDIARDLDLANLPSFSATAEIVEQARERNRSFRRRLNKSPL